MAKTRQATAAIRMGVPPAQRVTTTPRTAGYVSLASQYQQRPRDLPPLSFDIIRSMLLDPAVRLALATRMAPICGLEIAYKGETGPDGKPKWIPGVLARRPEVAEFVRRQLARIWTHGLDQILTAQIWGWSAGEVMMRATSRGTVEVDYLLGRHSSDTRALVRGGQCVGCRVLRVPTVPGGHVDLEWPKCWWHAHRPEAGAYYGTSIMLGMYSPWADKCFQGGATDVRRLFMHADGYGGKDMTYPDGETIINGVAVANRDIAMQIVEQLQAGGVTVRPSTMDAQGNELWKLTRATVTSNPQHILQYPKDLDTEIYHGAEIPDDVIESETGAWAGKRVPMAAFYNSLDLWALSLLGDLTVQILEPLVLVNFGSAEEFAVTHKPLGLQAMEQQSQATPGQPGQPTRPESPQPSPQQQFNQGPGQPPQQPGQQRMALDAEDAVGRGVLSAAELVKATRRVIRMQSEAEPHSFSSTQFNLLPELASRVLLMASRIHPDDLAGAAGDSIETEPHITVKYGLHTDDPEEVRRIVSGCPPVAMTFGATSIFSSDEHDVVKIDIESDGLKELNRWLSDKLPHTDTHPGYKPHLTIAYVKPGEGERIAATLNDLMGTVVVFDRLVFSDKFRRRHSIHLSGTATRFALESDAKWITIGGRKSGDAEHAGGFPVQIDADGIILKGGPKSLQGKHVSKIVSHFRKMRNAPAAKAKRAESINQRQAKSWDMSVDQYKQFSDQIWKDKADEHRARESAKLTARKSLGVTAGDVKRLEEQGFDYGSGKIKGLDTLGRELASQFPELGWGKGYEGDGGVDTTEYDANLWELLKEGKQDLPAKDSPEFHAEVDEYLSHLGSSVSNESSLGDEWDSVEF